MAASATLSWLPTDKFLSREKVKPRHQCGGVAQKEIACQFHRLPRRKAIRRQREQAGRVDGNLPDEAKLVERTGLPQKTVRYQENQHCRWHEPAKELVTHELPGKEAVPKWIE